MPEENEKLERRAFRRKLGSYVFATCIVIAFYFVLRNGRSVSAAFNHVNKVIQPILIGFVMAFLMNPIMGVIEKRLYKIFAKFCKTEVGAKKGDRALSSILALVVLVSIVIFIIASIVPNLISTIIYLANHIEDQIAGVLDWCNVVTKGNYEEALMKAKDNKIGDLVNQGLDLFNQYVDYDQSDMMSMITSSVLSVTKFIVNIIIGMFVSVYVLISKETFKAQAKKLVCGIFAPKYANIILEVSRKSGEIFYGFIIGKIIDSIIIGVICYIACLIMKMPYPMLVSVIVGVTNIVPVFGPYIGAVPTVIIIFLTEPMKGIYFLIFILILQQVDGNLIGPKILGDSTGISSFWVVFAVVVGAGFFGVGGMIVAVPIVAIIYYIVGRIASYLVERRDLPKDTNEYILMDYIDLESNTLIKHQEKLATSKLKFSFKLNNHGKK
ncbi:Predicted PurR-regulated permease PerM [Pseudobutyrivibrio sp. OR37]|uniref:AI-2E family transporter n=1 Tax=Pseudobutyrivibrio sp. OR37 TaxID=1798186 RepID=UPI0008E9EEB1|nr:AI-2E family transporter [Pseudobutyrivibrio sp. OR37]SFH80800.1 Predicted PurR-regulated permease PerM [Pseudobutyrivibrio sp. OR37]